MIRNLLNDLDGLASYMEQFIQEGSWLNTYLVAAGMWQVVEDYLHSDPLSLQRVEKIFKNQPRSRLKPLQAAVRTARWVEVLAVRRTPGFRHAQQWSKDWYPLVQDLARAALPGSEMPSIDGLRLARRSVELAARIRRLPTRLRRSILRLPNCFRSFDQSVEDMERLASLLAGQYPNPEQLLVIAGLRTSGSYLAPLCKAYLDQKGYRQVQALTFRPGAGFLPEEIASIRAWARRDAVFAVLDDPPVSGSSMVQGAEDLLRAGVPEQAVVMLVPLFGGLETLPQPLKSYRALVLPLPEWFIQESFTAEAVREQVNLWLRPGLEIREIERVEMEEYGLERGHLSGRYKLTVLDPYSGQASEKEIFVKGTGLGYFGEHTLDSVRSLGDYFPEVIGFHQGLLFREWLPDDRRLSRIDPGLHFSAARSMVDYVVARHRSLPVPEDISLRRSGEFPAWEVASNIVGQVYGRLWQFARVPLIDPVIKRLLRVASPSVVDAHPALDNWFYDAAKERIQKVAFEKGVFRNDIEFNTYDPVFDMAWIAAELDSAVMDGQEWAGQVLRRLRPLYESTAGEQVLEERWLLYQLVRIWEVQRRSGQGDTRRSHRAYSRAMQRYFHALYFQDLPEDPSGDICGLDIDGVLESHYLGFPALSPSSAMALRALAMHGYRSVLVTGRSMPEAVERCSLYPVAGAVVEYGAAIYNAGTKQVKVLLQDIELGVLGGLRAHLQSEPGVYLDTDFHYAVRAYMQSSGGRRVGLPPETAARTANACSGQGITIRAVPGDAQTDFMVERVTKATGLHVLLEELSPGITRQEGLPLAMAAGDTVSDLPMLAMARSAFIPGHASSSVDRPAVRRMEKAYQAGFAMAVETFLGHAPDRCPVCRPPELTADSRALLELFAVQENGMKSLLRSLAGRKLPHS